jgi:hypothetical protein
MCSCDQWNIHHEKENILQARQKHVDIEQFGKGHRDGNVEIKVRLP